MPTTNLWSVSYRNPNPMVLQAFAAARLSCKAFKLGAASCIKLCSEDAGFFGLCQSFDIRCWDKAAKLTALGERLPSLVEQTFQKTLVNLNIGKSEMIDPQCCFEGKMGINISGL